MWPSDPGVTQPVGADIGAPPTPSHGRLLARLKRPMAVLVLLVSTVTVLRTCQFTMPVEQISVKATILTAGGDGPRYKRIPQKEYTRADVVVFYTTVEWADVERSAGTHAVQWKWYNNDKLVSVIDNRFVFDSTPFDLWSDISAQGLGVGHNKVEFYIDRQLMASETLSVE